MSNLVKIGNKEILIKEYKGKRVVTFKDIDTVHERPDGTARKRFSDNRERFIQGVDYFIVTPQMLEITEMSEKRTLENVVTSNRGTALITETGYLMLVKSFTDDLAWEVQRKLVDSYFRVRKTINEELSPQMQLLMQMVNTMAEKELKDKERDRQIALAKQTADKAVETTEKIKDEFIQEFDNWRNDVNSKVREIAINSEIPYQTLFSEIYSELERRAGCDLSARQRNKRARMVNNGSRKSDIEKETTKIAIVEEDKKLKQIFDDIVRRYAVKYIT